MYFIVKKKCVLSNKKINSQCIELHLDKKDSDPTYFIVKKFLYLTKFVEVKGEHKFSMHLTKTTELDPTQ